MNYQVITDLAELNRFIGGVLPVLNKHEIFYCCLFARKKYCSEPWLKADKSQLKRFTSTGDRLVRKLRQLECTLDSYRSEDDLHGIPQEALACYISVNPRSLWLATLHGISDLAKMVECEAKGANPHQEIMSTIQRTKSRSVYVTFDIDSKEPAVKERIDEFLDGDRSCRLLLETRGGYHCLVMPEKVPDSVRKTWHKNLATMADVTGDAMIPIPGTYQGGFTPRFV